VQRLHRFEPGRLHRGIHAGHEPDDHGHEKREKERPSRDDRRPAGEAGNTARYGKSEGQAQGAAYDRDERRLEDELANDVDARGADGAAKADSGVRSITLASMMFMMRCLRRAIRFRRQSVF
jgi:hypothetical protein